MTDRPASLNNMEMAYTKALASWTTRYVDPSGFECQLSLESETGSEVLAKAEAAIARLTDLKCVPFHPGNHNGNGQGEVSQTSPKTIQKVDGQVAMKLCPIHNIEMQFWQKGTKTWYSHRWQAGWCKGGTK